MPITITSSVQTELQQWHCSVVLTAQSAIVDPAGYVSGSATVQAEILAKAGLDADLVYVATTLTSTATIGYTYQYYLTVVFGSSALTGGGHTHDCDTVDYPLQCGYTAGPTVNLDATLGAVIFKRPTTPDITMFAVQAGTNNLFRVGPGTEIRFGGHFDFYPDATYDVGTVDAGVTLHRPRDVRISRDLYAGGIGQFGSYGSFGGYVQATHDRLVAQAVNPTTDAAVRHLYVNSVDNSLRWWDGTTEHIIGVASGSDTVGLWNCSTLVQERDIVFCDAADHVDRASAATLTGRTVVGICAAKLSSTTALIRYSGETTGYTGLMPGAAYYVGVGAGTMQQGIGGFIEGYTVVRVGTAKNTTTLVQFNGEPRVY
jgi:hypothetical protein